MVPASPLPCCMISTSADPASFALSAACLSCELEWCVLAQATQADRDPMRRELPHSQVPHSAPRLPAKKLRLLRGVSPGQPTSPAAGRSPLSAQRPQGSDGGASSFVVPFAGAGQQRPHDGFDHERHAAADDMSDAADERGQPSYAASLATNSGARSPMPPSVAAALEVRDAGR